MPVGLLISIETGSEPVSLEKSTPYGSFQGIYQFVEDWDNILPKLLPNECFRILVVASIFYFRQITLNC